MSNIAIKGTFTARTLSRQRIGRRDSAKGKSSLISAVKVIVIILFAALFYLWSRLEVVSVGYEIAEANKARAELMSDNKRLKLALLSLKSPERIENIAANKFGLVYPKGEQVVIVR